MLSCTLELSKERFKEQLPQQLAAMQESFETMVISEVTDLISDSMFQINFNPKEGQSYLVGS